MVVEETIGFVVVFVVVFTVVPVVIAAVLVDEIVCVVDGGSFVTVAGNGDWLV